MIGDTFNVYYNDSKSHMKENDIGINDKNKSNLIYVQSQQGKRVTLYHIKEKGRAESEQMESPSLHQSCKRSCIHVPFCCSIIT